MEEANLLFKKGEKVAKLSAFVLFALSALKGIAAVISDNIALLANIAFYSRGFASNQSFGIFDFDVCFSFHVVVWKTAFKSKHCLLSGAEMVFVGILAAIIPHLIGDILLPTIISEIIGWTTKKRII